MTTRKSVCTLAIAALLVATPAMGQLLNHPVQALPAGDAAGATFFGAQFLRGLNDDSFKDSSFGVGVGRAMERVSFMGMAGYVLDYGTPDGDSELTLGANVAVHLLSDDSTPVQVSVQAGFGWASLDVGTESLSWMSFPIGVAISGRPSGGATTVTPWVMPRLDIQRTGELLLLPSSTETNFGAAAGVSVTREDGIGGHLAIDYLNVSGGSPFGFAVGVHYIVGN